ncbi:DUF411 domain-containing protein [Arsukibacterium perlucidum]|uniref:DUF411 domain-containing protein n=1 Tax=Arsukibacterium perlucidum TaxID=368811 RepID=UPI00036D1C3A|nr:DUF411 domain-containing protein [Arsukibacterium perlucidum]
MKLTLIAAMLAATALLAGCKDAGPAKPETTAVPDSAAALTLTVYKTPSCGCCKKWVSHLEQQGVVAQTKDYDDLSGIKERYGITPQYYSCHTAVSEQGYAFEGHIPAKYIRKFLAESHPDAIGLSVPAMPLGSPGMEVEGRFMPYDILLLHKDGSASVYAHISDAAMQ